MYVTAGGIYLLEIHRILRPEGFWVLSGPPINYQRHWRGWNTTIETQKSDYNKLQKLLASMCFKLSSKKDDIAVWQKSSNGSCYNQLSKPDAYLLKCDDSLEPDSAWYTPLRPCIVVPNLKLKKLDRCLSGLSVCMSPPRGSLRFTVGVPAHDNSKLKVRASHYKKLRPAIGTNKIRNVMDMNTVYGVFASAVIKEPVWVLKKSVHY